MRAAEGPQAARNQCPGPSLQSEGKREDGEVEGVWQIYRASQVAQWVKDPPTMQETLVRSLGQEDPLEEGMVKGPFLIFFYLQLKMSSLPFQFGGLKVYLHNVGL